MQNQSISKEALDEMMCELTYHPSLDEVLINAPVGKQEEVWKWADTLRARYVFILMMGVARNRSLAADRGSIRVLGTDIMKHVLSFVDRP